MAAGYEARSDILAFNIDSIKERVGTFPDSSILMLLDLRDRNAANIYKAHLIHEGSSSEGEADHDVDRKVKEFGPKFRPISWIVTSVKSARGILSSLSGDTTGFDLAVDRRSGDQRVVAIVAEAGTAYATISPA